MFDTEDPAFEVTLSRSLYRKLQNEALQLDVPFEWLIASLVADAVEEPQNEDAGTVAA